MMRRCDGTDPNLHDEQRQPCACGLVFDDVDRMVIFPHDPVGGSDLLTVLARTPAGSVAVTSKATLKILAEQGVTAKDIEQIEKARKLVDAVNARLIAAGAPINYCVVIVSALAPRPQWPADILE